MLLRGSSFEIQLLLCISSPEVVLRGNPMKRCYNLFGSIFKPLFSMHSKISTSSLIETWVLSDKLFAKLRCNELKQNGASIILRVESILLSS